MDSFTDIVVVRVSVALDEPRAGEKLLEYATRLNLTDFATLLRRVNIDFAPSGAIPRARSSPAVRQHPVPPGRSFSIAGRTAIAHLARYFRIDAGGAPGLIPRMLASLGTRKGRELDVLYRETLVGPAGGPAVTTNDPYFAQGLQGYLKQSPEGIDAEWLWNQGFAGNGIGFADVEQGWDLPHTDLPAALNVVGVSQLAEQDHGTAVLGIVCGLDNTIGVLGATPKVSTPLLYATHQTATDENVAQAIEDAAFALWNARAANPHPVLLLEVQEVPSKRPIERRLLERAEIIKATDVYGIVVIEPAGNGGENLDNVNDWDQKPLNDTDSGAVMVGAASRPGPANITAGKLDRWASSNYGARVDCFAWGSDVWTTSPGDQYAVFSGTSSASAIIAGAAVLLRQVSGGAVPKTIRDWLREASNGTGSTNPAQWIGYMPNLRKIYEAKISPPLPPPNVFIRDTLIDTGLVPTQGAVSTSPDIIVRANAEQDSQAAQAAFGEGSGEESNGELSVGTVQKLNHFIYVRLRNRGGTPANGAQVTVYWSKPATLLDPAMWSIIDAVQVDVDPAAGLVVAPEITWDAAKIPAPGHYCFIAVVDHADDPLTLPADTTAGSFADFVRSENNVAWRNFNVVPVPVGPVTPASPPPPEMAFWMRGVPGEAAQFDFEMMRSSPRQANFTLDLPEAPFEDAHLHAAAFHRDPDRGRLRIELPYTARVRTPVARLEADANLQAHLILENPSALAPEGETVAIRQIFRGVEVGRLTWKFVPTRRSGTGQRMAHVPA